MALLVSKFMFSTHVLKPGTMYVLDTGLRRSNTAPPNTDFFMITARGISKVHLLLSFLALVPSATIHTTRGGEDTAPF